MCISYLGDLTLRYKSYHLERVKHFSLEAITYKSDRCRKCFCLFALFRLFYFSFVQPLAPVEVFTTLKIIFESQDLPHWGKKKLCVLLIMFVFSCNRLFYENKLLDGVTAEDRTQVVVSEMFHISYLRQRLIQLPQHASCSP